MAAPTMDTSKPVFGANAVDSDLTQLRDNIVWLMQVAASQGYALPGWTTTVVGTAEPSQITLAKSNVKIQFNFTWSSGNLATEIWKYDKNLGAGLETLVGGTFTHSYDGSNNWTGVTTA